MSRPPKARKISVFLAFSRFSSAVCFGKKLLTTDLTTYGKTAKIEYFFLSGCGAVGSARRLGACDRLVSQPPKAREISVFLAFSRFSAPVCFGKKLLTTDLTTYGFDRKNRISGCRVTVTHQFWELAQAGSTPVIPTNLRLFDRNRSCKEKSLQLYFLRRHYEGNNSKKQIVRKFLWA